MEPTDKHYKFINSSTGYSIYYYSLSGSLTPEEVKAELEKTQAFVASKNGLLLNTVYWQEIKDESDG
ncbi:hypothetical protein DJ568_01635 [Mucilaginibacter hurinus]|uniref:Uncharacterized protein n=1 Tax=Mucilaginibacter hurinus TaxID=2201324 RepID=A0A367GT44_9SPHI|nr:hypothetical protein [Mucilaginibacter hurinus]RCH56587.1 hypothetical protein DJ568_01635 [Mucilaginibacter hurinus]